MAALFKKLFSFRSQSKLRPPQPPLDPHPYGPPCEIEIVFAENNNDQPSTPPTLSTVQNDNDLLLSLSPNYLNLVQTFNTIIEKLKKEQSPEECDMEENNNMFDFDLE
jgi:hypothetical protein